MKTYSGYVEMWTRPIASLGKKAVYRKRQPILDLEQYHDVLECKPGPPQARRRCGLLPPGRASGCELSRSSVALSQQLGGVALGSEQRDSLPIKGDEGIATHPLAFVGDCAIGEVPPSKEKGQAGLDRWSV